MEYRHRDRKPIGTLICYILVIGTGIGIHWMDNFFFREIFKRYAYGILIICYRRDFDRGRVGYSQLTVPNTSRVPLAPTYRPAWDAGVGRDDCRGWKRAEFMKSRVVYTQHHRNAPE